MHVSHICAVQFNDSFCRTAVSFTQCAINQETVLSHHDCPSSITSEIRALHLNREADRRMTTHVSHGLEKSTADDSHVQIKHGLRRSAPSQHTVNILLLPMLLLLFYGHKTRKPAAQVKNGRILLECGFTTGNWLRASTALGLNRRCESLP